MDKIAAIKNGIHKNKFIVIYNYNHYNDLHIGILINDQYKVHIMTFYTKELDFNVNQELVKRLYGT